jgi:16S rRNA (cytosine967-C5)-methyltransferase
VAAIAPALAELTAKQAAILDSAARLLKPDGRIVYATCSLLRAENEEIAAGFTVAHPGFRRLSVRELLESGRVARGSEALRRGWPGPAAVAAAAWY